MEIEFASAGIAARIFSHELLSLFSSGDETYFFDFLDFSSNFGVRFLISIETVKGRGVLCFDLGMLLYRTGNEYSKGPSRLGELIPLLFGYLNN